MELVDYASLAELEEAARSRDLRIADVVLAQQAAELDLPPETIRARLRRRLDVMRLDPPAYRVDLLPGGPR